MPLTIPGREFRAPCAYGRHGLPIVGIHTFLNMLQLIANLAPRLSGEIPQILFAVTHPDNLGGSVILALRISRLPCSCLFALD